MGMHEMNVFREWWKCKFSYREIEIEERMKLFNRRK